MCVFLGSAFWGIFNGLGKHITELTPAELTVQVKVRVLFTSDPCCDSYSAIYLLSVIALAHQRIHLPHSGDIYKAVNALPIPQNIHHADIQALVLLRDSVRLHIHQ